MKAFAVDPVKNSLEEPSFFQVEMDRPHLGPRDVLVEVKAISVNPLDVKRRMLVTTTKGDGASTIMGWDGCGVVIEKGEDVSLFQLGDEIYYAGEITRQGSYAQYQAVDERIAGHKPRSLSFERSAALALTTITAWESLFDRLRVVPIVNKAGDRLSPLSHPAKSILIIGGAGGVGSMAIQLARQVAGLKVIATASRPSSISWCESLGAHHVVDHNQNWVQAVRDLGFQHVDHVLILNDTDAHFDAACELLAPQGLMCSIVPNQKPLNMDALRAKSAGFFWEAMFVRSKEKTPDMVEQHHLLNQVAAWIDRGLLRDTGTQFYAPITAAHLRQAHLALQSQRTIGKIVLSSFE